LSVIRHGRHGDQDGSVRWRIGYQGSGIDCEQSRFREWMLSPATVATAARTGKLSRGFHGAELFGLGYIRYGLEKREKSALFKARSREDGAGRAWRPTPIVPQSRDFVNSARQAGAQQVLGG
jgi:hypothetical protein